MTDLRGVDSPQYDLISLYVFVTAAREPSFRAAAQRLNLTVPAISDRIKKLERQFGFSLFDRSPSGVSLTNPGRQVFEYALRILRSSNRLDEYARGVTAGTAGHISIACYPVHIERMLGNVMGGFRSSFPDVRIDLSQMRDDRRRTFGQPLREELVEGSVDLAVMPKQQNPESDDLDGAFLYTASIVALVPDNDAYRNSPEIPIDRLKDRQLLIAPPSFFSRERVARAAKESGFDIIVSIQSSTPSALLTLGRNGFGLPVLPDDYPLVGQQRFPYPVISDSKGERIQTDVWMYWRKSTADVPAMASFIAEVKSYVEKEQRNGRRPEEYYLADLRNGSMESARIFNSKEQTND